MLFGAHGAPYEDVSVLYSVNMTMQNQEREINEEANHEIETDPYNRKVAYGDNSNELMSDIAGARHMYDKELINDVHQYIDFKDGQFNTNPAKEFVRRRNVEGNTDGYMTDENLKSYMSNLETEAVNLTDRYNNDKVFKHRIDSATKNSGRDNDAIWRNKKPNSRITKDSGFFSDVANAFGFGK